MTDGPEHPEPRHADPERPEIPIHLPLQPDIPRPRILHLTLALVVAAALALVPATVRAVPRLDDIRTKLEDDLASNSPDYPASDVETAVTVFLVGVVVLSVLLVLAEIRAMQQVRRKRRGGRTWLVILTMVHVPLIAMSPYIREDEQADVTSAAVQGVCLVLATSLCFLPKVTRWLLAVKRQGPIPLRPAAERQS